MSDEPFNRPGVSRRMNLLCANCRWLEQDYDHCNEIRKGFDCDKYQVKTEIEEKRAADKSLQNPTTRTGNSPAPSTPAREKGVASLISLPTRPRSALALAGS